MRSLSALFYLLTVYFVYKLTKSRLAADPKHRPGNVAVGPGWPLVVERKFGSLFWPGLAGDRGCAENKPFWLVKPDATVVRYD